jgi:3-deoxy-manno-octulosonate cytidylyltransferase (CMP-KDO synthetase)
LKIGIIIPARLHSQRLPEKVLMEFAGSPMIQHVWERAVLSDLKLPIVITTGDDLIIQACSSFGATVVKSESEHKNALSRITEVAMQLNWDYYIVLQADELFVLPKEIKKIRETILSNPEIDFINTISDLESLKEITDVNVVKCSIRGDNTIIIMFRKKWSISSDDFLMNNFKKVCGIYAVSHKALEQISQKNDAKFYESESIEQLIFLENGIKALSMMVQNNYISVNTKKDAKIAKKIIRKDRLQIEILSKYNK